MYISKDEMYNWMPCITEDFADADISKELGEKLIAAIDNYKNICKEIYRYLEENPSAVKREYE